MNLDEYYETWYIDKYLKVEMDIKTAPYLLNTTKTPCKVMIYGQESNELGTDINSPFSEVYKKLIEKQDEYKLRILNYSKIITPAGKVTNRLGNFEYIHLALCGISTADRKGKSEKDELEKRYYAIRVNNINKVSQNGKYTPLQDDYKILFDAIKDGKNIYQFELEYFKPSVLVFFCGPHYKSHIEEAFRVKIGDDKKPNKEDYVKDITDCFIEYKDKGIEKVFYSYHPQYLRFSKKIKDYFLNNKELLKSIGVL